MTKTLQERIQDRREREHPSIQGLRIRLADLTKQHDTTLAEIHRVREQLYNAFRISDGEAAQPDRRRGQ